VISSFKGFLVEEEKTVYFTFGRMNPPTIGHEKLLQVLASKAGKNPYRVYLSQSEDQKKNPLSYKDKVKIARKMFPKYARSIMMNTKIKTAIDAATQLYNDGYVNLVMVAGGDRVPEFDILLKKYNGVKGRHGFYNFNKITVVSAGARDPDAEGVEGMSASKMRDAAKLGDFTKFSQGIPKNVSNADTKALYNAVRKGMGLKEAKETTQHVQLEQVSEIRESYVNGELFKEGDTVVIKDTGELAKVKTLGSNYVIVEGSGNKYRKWLDAVEKVEDNNVEYEVAPFSVKMESLSEAQDPDIKDRPGTQPARYHKGLAKSTKVKRDAQFKKQTKMADDDPAAYKPAPGDATAKTKPSKYTKAFKQMFGEDTAVGGKQYKYLHHCPSAITAFKKDIKMHGNTNEIHKAISAVDHYLEVEDNAKKRGYATQADIDLMKKRQQPAKAAIQAAGLKDHNYHQSHIDTLKDMLKEPTNEQNIERVKDRISREREIERRRDAADKKRHDSMMDRARSARTRRINRRTS